ncbi:MAG: DUF4864 domain-containing protein, partial [Haloarculaceae archaeon]
MSLPPLRVGIACLLLVGLAGCSSILGLADRQSTPTVTPAPVPEVTATDRPATPTSAGATVDRQSVPSSRYATLRPTCRRPPGVVIHIQVAALARNNATTNDGIRTTWRFAAPSNRQATGPFENFARLIKSSYRPLLRAQTITYDPLRRSNGTAQRRVTVETSNRTTTYLWTLENQTAGEYEG